MRPPGSASTAEVAEVEAQKPEAFTSLKVDYAALFIIDFNLQLAEFLPKPFVHGPNQPVVSLKASIKITRSSANLAYSM